MSKYKVALFAIHGMGRTRENFAEPLWESLKKKIGGKWGNVLHQSFYYQDILQENQDRVFDAMEKEIDWKFLRRFLLFGFSDAASMEHRADTPDSIYEKVQEKILNALEDTLDPKKGNIDPSIPIVIVAQSLGGHVISNYIWDAQKASRAPRGVFRKGGRAWKLTKQKREFCRLKSLKLLVTTGCNIPLFVAGKDSGDIKPIETQEGGYLFKWHNFYDKDDVLGWPLRPLSDEYKKLPGLKDEEVNVGNMLTWWNPLSHTSYWEDGDVINPLRDELLAIINPKATAKTPVKRPR